VQAESSKFASLSFDQGFQIVIPPRSLASLSSKLWSRKLMPISELSILQTKVVTNNPPAPSGGDRAEGAGGLLVVIISNC
jgi:hypothetical protein